MRENVVLVLDSGFLSATRVHVNAIRSPIRIARVNVAATKWLMIGVIYVP